MKADNIYRLITLFLSRRFSPETEERVQKWIIKDGNLEEKEQASFDFWNELESEATPDTYSAFGRVNKRIGCPQIQAVKIPLYKKISRIAAIIIPLLILAGGYLYYSTRNNLMEITVAFGEEKHMFLPDSSEIWLNSGTVIRYPHEFKGNRRTVYLDGEGYFSVKRNEEKPFIVETEQLTVKVLGTKFNIKAYSTDEKTVTTLTSGKVEINIDDKQSCILKPNEQLIYNRNTSIMDVREIPSNETSSWLSGQLIFNNSSLNDILRTLERRFNISFANNTAIPESKLFTVKFLKNEDPDEILKILQDVIGFDYQRQGDKIILTRD